MLVDPRGKPSFRTGCLMLWRQTPNNPILAMPPHRLAVWLYLLLHAAHDGCERPPSVSFQGKQIYLRPGQLTAGAQQIAFATGVPKTTVERSVKLFESEAMIEVQRSSQCSLYTIKNWKSYQSHEAPNATQPVPTRSESGIIIRIFEFKNCRRRQEENFEVAWTTMH